MIGMTESCASCLRWLVTDMTLKDGARLGECRAKAPTLITSNGAPKSRWPFVREDAVCGDYRLAPTQEPQGVTDEG